MSNNDRSVYRRSDGKWANKKDSASKASSVHDTQKDAAKAAKKNLNNQGGGELKIMGRDGKIRSKDTISPAMILSHREIRNINKQSIFN